VWVADARSPGAQVAWRNGNGRYRNIGDAPGGAEVVEPTIEDAYLLLLGDRALGAAA
jgi:ABC-2 type transport system ATP-binding protein